MTERMVSKNYEPMARAWFAKTRNSKVALTASFSCFVLSLSVDMTKGGNAHHRSFPAAG